MRMQEFGVCSHWRYKGTDAKSTGNSYEDKISWLRQVFGSGTKKLKVIMLRNYSALIMVLTEFTSLHQKVMWLILPWVPRLLDFAYRVHTSIGHRCRGAKINGKIVPLNTALHTADQVIILTGKQESPSRDWLSSALGYLYTARARAKVQQWFRKQNMEQKYPCR